MEFSRRVFVYGVEVKVKAVEHSTCHGLMGLSVRLGIGVNMENAFQEIDKHSPKSTVDGVLGNRENIIYLTDSNVILTTHKK